MEFVYFCQKFSSQFGGFGFIHMQQQNLLSSRKSVGKKYFSAFILQHKSGKLANKRASEVETGKREWKSVEYIVCVCALHIFSVCLVSTFNIPFHVFT